MIPATVTYQEGQSRNDIIREGNLNVTVDDWGRGIDLFKNIRLLMTSFLDGLTYFFRQLDFNSQETY